MAFQKGHKFATGRPKGSKNVETIKKEERRHIFDSEVSQMFIEKIGQARPEYLLDQFMGPATQKLDVTSDGKELKSMVPEILILAEEELKRRKTEGNSL